MGTSCTSGQTRIEQIFGNFIKVLLRFGQLSVKMSVSHSFVKAVNRRAQLPLAQTQSDLKFQIQKYVARAAVSCELGLLSTMTN